MRAVTVGNLRFRVDPAQRKESHKQIPLGLKPARNDKTARLKSCPPVVPSHTVRRGTLEPYPDASRLRLRCLRQAGGFLVHRLKIRALQDLIRARFLAHLVEQLNYITVLLLGFCLIPRCA